MIPSLIIYAAEHGNYIINPLWYLCIASLFASMCGLMSSVMQKQNFFFSEVSGLGGTIILWFFTLPRKAVQFYHFCWRKLLGPTFLGFLVLDLRSLFCCTHFVVGPTDFGSPTISLSYSTYHGQIEISNSPTPNKYCTYILVQLRGAIFF